MSDEEKNKMKSALLPIGINLVVCIVFLLYAFITYANDTSQRYGYNYHSPLTNHEIMVIILGVLGFFGMLLCSGLLAVIINKLNKN